MGVIFLRKMTDFSQLGHCEKCNIIKQHDYRLSKKQKQNMKDLFKKAYCTPFLMTSGTDTKII